MRKTAAFAVPFTVAAALAAAPGAVNAAAPQYLTEARCLGVYEATAFIFTQLGGGTAGDAGTIAGALNNIARENYTRTIEGVIARDDMNDEELAEFRDMHLGNSETIRGQYSTGELGVFDAGQLMMGCNAELGYANAG